MISLENLSSLYSFAVFLASMNQEIPVRTPRSSRLARILHEGGPLISSMCIAINAMHELRGRICKVQFVLFGFGPHLALHLVRSLLNHSAHYASASDLPTCFASSTLKSESPTQYPG